MSIAGIDYSMTSPAICIYSGDVKDMNFDACNFRYLTKIKKYETSFKNVVGDYLEYSDDMQRYDKISSYFLDTMLDNNVTKAYIEGYSMGSKGRVFNIAENTGVLKYRMWSFGIDFETVAPTTIKKFATGKGNSNKEHLQEQFQSESSVDLKYELNMTEKQWNPSSDIIDAYYICKYGVNMEMDNDTKQ